jgi:hypothetical protein
MVSEVNVHEVSLALDEEDEVGPVGGGGECGRLGKNTRYRVSYRIEKYRYSKKYHLIKNRARSELWI